MGLVNNCLFNNSCLLQLMKVKSDHPDIKVNTLWEFSGVFQSMDVQLMYEL